VSKECESRASNASVRLVWAAWERGCTSIGVPPPPGACHRLRPSPFKILRYGRRCSGRTTQGVPLIMSVIARHVLACLCPLGLDHAHATGSAKKDSDVVWVSQAEMGLESGSHVTRVVEAERACRPKPTSLHLTICARKCQGQPGGPDGGRPPHHGCAVIIRSSTWTAKSNKIAWLAAAPVSAWHVTTPTALLKT